MQAVHFGAGNIGRGFIGSLLTQSNYHTVFVDVNHDLIESINEKHAYQVTLTDKQQQSITISNIAGLNSLEQPDKVIEAIVQSDIVTTAVGPSILPIIAELLAEGLKARVASNGKPLNIIACENMIGGSEFLREKVMEHISGAGSAAFTSLFGFPNAAVDRIVPNQSHQNVLDVSVEPYYEWVVEETNIKGNLPAIEGITYVPDLTPYIERKLFTVNTGHAVPAYLGYYMGYQTINEAMNDKHIQETIKRTLAETGEALIHTYHFDAEKHEEYINNIIQRFMNPYISDEVTRVARGPLRKLGAADRLIRPAVMYLETTGKAPKYLAKVIASALNYDYESDQEAVKLQEMIKKQGYEQTLNKVCGLEVNHPLVPVILQQLKNLTV